MPDKKDTKGEVISEKYQPIDPKPAKRLTQEEYEEIVRASVDMSKRVRAANIKGKTAGHNLFVHNTFDQMIQRRNKDLMGKVPKRRKDLFKFHPVSVKSRVYHDVINSCRDAYRNYGVIRNVVDLLSNFVSKVTIHHPDPKVRQFYNAWAAKVQLNERINTLVRDLLVHGQVFIYRSMARISSKDKREMRQQNEAFGQGDKKLVVIREDGAHHTVEPPRVDGMFTKGDHGEQPPSAKDRIPWKYQSLNPLQLEPTGGVFEGESKWRFLIRDKDDLLKVGLTDSCIEEGSSDNLPKDWKGKAVKRDKSRLGDIGDYEYEVPLSDKQLYTIYDKRFDFEDWAIPFIFPALRDLQLKDVLRDMEVSSAKSVMTSIMLIKLGMIKEGFVPPEEAVQAVADMIGEPGESTHLIWGTDDIQAEYIQPDLGAIFDPKKMERVDQDILTALGAAEVVVAGKGGGNFSNSFLSVAAMLERLENVKEKIRLWLRLETKIIADAIGYKKLPTITFETSSLRDQRTQDDFMIKLHQAGVISTRTLQQYGNVDPDAEEAQIKREADEVEKGDRHPTRSPFSNPLEDEVLKEKMKKSSENPLPSDEEALKKKEKEMKLMQKLQEKEETAPPSKPGSSTPKQPKSEDRGGRPPGTNTPHKVKRDTKPKGMASFKEYKLFAHRAIGEIEHCLYKNIEYLTGISAVDLDGEVHETVRNEVMAVLGEVQVGDDIKPSLVVDILHRMKTEAPAKLDRCVQRVYNQKISSYKKKNGKSPDAKKKKDLLSSSWAICRSSLGI